MADITMPQLGETVTEGTITRWAKQVGDRIEEDEVLFEVSTDKVDSEVPAPTSGYVAEILVPEGETVAVGTRLAVISDQPVEGGGAAAEPTEAQPAPEPVEAPSGSGSEGGATPAPEPQPGDTPAEVAAKAEQAGASEPAATAIATQAQQSEDNGARGNGGGGAVLSPVVRRLIAEHNLDPARIEGTGAGGRITRADVLAVIERGEAGGTAAPPAPAPAPTTKPAPAPAARAGERDEVVPFSNIRRLTAEHMRRSLDTSAHTLVVIEVDYENVDKVRRAAKDRFKAEEGVSLTYMPFVARAVVDAIREYPHVNASVGDNELVVHRYVNLGVAVDLDFQGLIVPVVHDADTKRLRALAREIADLAVRARSKKLGADEISGGTFTITNAGGYGTLVTAPIINQPQVAILSTDGVKPRPVAVTLPDGTYGIAVHPVGNLAVSFDHRAYDGAYASAFLAMVKEILETRDWSQELA
ncbi:MAG TPA: dihydrolipoamide acetyltransferase family protein [Acidimicrobiales bacterium]|nr:dihydrolipoamide acetyltransferase family protein [Acidimicrobiales bacterium]